MTANLLQSKLSLLESAPTALIQVDFLLCCTFGLCAPTACCDQCEVMKSRAADLFSIDLQMTGGTHTNYCIFAAFIILSISVRESGRRCRHSHVFKGGENHFKWSDLIVLFLYRTMLH